MEFMTIFGVGSFHSYSEEYLILFQRSWDSGITLCNYISLFPCLIIMSLLFVGVYDAQRIVRFVCESITVLGAVVYLISAVHEATLQGLKTFGESLQVG